MSNPNSTIRSLRAAVSFLTVLPVANVDGSPGERLGRAYFPAIGAFIGLAAGAVFAVLSSVTTPLLAAAGGVAVLSVLTGAMHLDGLADSADGLLGGGDVTRRLEKMRDPRLGSFGVAAIALPLVGLTALGISTLARRRVGGATGDVCGAAAELCQLATLLVFAIR